MRTQTKQAIHHLIEGKLVVKHENPKDFVDGAAQVMDYYGFWPSFHDADYVAIYLDMNGPAIQIDFRLYDWDDATKIANRPSIKLLWHSVEGSQQDYEL